jgi:hypothetical protein
MSLSEGALGRAPGCMRIVYRASGRKKVGGSVFSPRLRTCTIRLDSLLWFGRLGRGRGWTSVRGGLSFLDITTAWLGLGSSIRYFDQKVARLARNSASEFLTCHWHSILPHEDLIQRLARYFSRLKFGY